MGSSDYYGANEGSDVYKDDSDNVIRTNPAEHAKKQEQTPKKYKDNGERKTLRATVNDDYNDYTGINLFDIIESFSKIIFFLLPLILIIVAIYYMLTSMNELNMATNSSSELIISNVTSTLEGVTSIMSAFPFFVVIGMFVITLYFIMRILHNPMRGL